jgi:hypothetical protein
MIKDGPFEINGMLKSIIMNYIIACCLVLGEDNYSLIHLSNPFHFSEKNLNKQVASEENCESIFDNIGVKNNLKKFKFKCPKLLYFRLRSAEIQTVAL